MVVLAVCAWCIYAELREGNALDQTRLDADLVTSYEAANIVMDLYGRIATMEGDAGMLAKAESYMAQRGVLKGWKVVREAGKKARVDKQMEGHK